MDKHAALLRARGLKATRTRLLVMQALHQAKGPLSARAIQRAASHWGPIDKVTVYRTLETLYQQGLLEKTRAGDRAWLYHLVNGSEHGRHPHFLCSGCGDLKCLPPDTMRLDLERLRSVFPAQVDHLRVSLGGLCPKCLASNQR